MPSLAGRPRQSSIPLLPISSRPASHTSVPENKIEKDDIVWKEYVDAARGFDQTMVEEWNKFLDVILVFVSVSLP
jgi:Family of unknown function (DUF6535)